MKVIELDHGEMTVVYTLAAMRNAINRSAGTKDKKIGTNHHDLRVDQIGLMAEIAWAKWRNTYPDLTIVPRKGSHDGVFNGKTVDIKASEYDGARLLAAPWKKDDPADAYVLATISNNEVTFVGYAKSSELFDEKNLINLGHGKGYALNQCDLQEFNDDRV